MKIIAILGLVVFSVLSTDLRSAPNDLGVTSLTDFDTTLNIVKRKVKEANLNLSAEIDHSKGAASVNLKLPRTVLLVVGNPKVGTLFMQKDQLAGLELPLKILVWESPKGNTIVSYRSPLQSLGSFQDLNPILIKMEKTLSDIAQSVSMELK